MPKTDKGRVEGPSRGERRRIVARAAFATVSLLRKWDLGSKEGVKIRPSHFRRDCR